jgi:serine/threonine-protein kinase
MLKQIGKFTISERIGRGAYSRVYRAVDAQGRAVAIKVSTTRTEPQHLDEFQKDLVAAASVLHPNLVAVHDLGFEDDFPYIVMELVEGQDLDRLLKSHADIPLIERVRVMEQIGGALKAAHERGIFHLDVRPSKIVLASNGEAKLLDLGLGRLSFDPARVTEHGYLIGAPFYMSPERLTAIDTANEGCDIWSFGVASYEWLAGHHPFYDEDGDRMIGNVMDSAPADLLDVPPALNHAIMRALEKDPADRYHNFAELLADLQPVAGDLKREENDALMAEALKQTDSGRWHEARRIARQMRDLEPEQHAGSQMFGISEPEVERERVAEPMRTAAAAVAPAQTLAASASAAMAVETPEPAPPPPPVFEQLAQPQAAPAARPPQRPERTAPKIPPMGVKNGASTLAPTPTNGARMAAAAGAGATISAASRPPVIREMEAEAKTEPIRAEPPRPEPPRSAPTRQRPRSTPPQPLTPPDPQSSVRIFDVEEASFPWAKVIGFAVPTLLMIAALFFFLRPINKTLKASSSPEEGKEVSRVIKPDTESSTAIFAPSQTTTNPQDAGTPTDADPLAAPRTFDAKSLPAAKLQVATRRGANKGPLTGLAAPALPDESTATEMAKLPVSFSGPPPPAAIAPVAPPPAKSTPPPVVAPVQSLEAARESASHVGGLFAQPELVVKVNPIYPAAAVQRKAEGTVRFQATIAKDGSVKNIQLLSGDPLLNTAARRAVLQWKYRPATLNGTPTEVTQAIVVKFSLSNK